MNFTIVNKNKEHSIYECHNTDFSKAMYLFSLFDDSTNKNTDEAIIDFARLNNDFTVDCYIANTFETKADAFMLSVIFNKTNVYNKLLETNEHKLDKRYPFGLGMTTTPRKLLANEPADIM